MDFDIPCKSLEMSKSIFGENKKNIIKWSAAELNSLVLSVLTLSIRTGLNDAQNGPSDHCLQCLTLIQQFDTSKYCNNIFAKILGYE